MKYNVWHMYVTLGLYTRTIIKAVSDINLRDCVGIDMLSMKCVKYPVASSLMHIRKSCSLGDGIPSWNMSSGTNACDFILFMSQALIFISHIVL
jgi:hypothetical protein